MKSRYPLVRLGELLQPALRDGAVEVQAPDSYGLVGVYSYGRGLFSKPVIRGGDMKYRTLFRLRGGQLVVARLNAWEGAIAAVPPQFGGKYVTQEFPVFDINPTRGELAYLGWLAKWPALWAAFGDRTQGSMVRRKRIQPADVLAIEVPLPGRHEQSRVAARLGRFEERLEALSPPVARFATLARVALPSLIKSILDSYVSENHQVLDLTDFVSDTVRPGSDPGLARAFVGLQHIESHTGRRLGESPLGGETGRKFRFAPGDILYGYLRPYLNKVWLAECHGLCSVEQYVLRPKEPDLGPLIAHALRSQAVLKTAIGLTHNLQLPRLRSGLLASIELRIPLPPTRSQCLARLASVNDRVVRLLDLSVRRDAVTSALMPSLLNRAFAGEL